MKLSQIYPSIMNFYEKRQNNEYFLRSNTIEFGKKSSKLLNNRLHLAKTKHIIMEKLDDPLKGVDLVSISNLTFAKAQWGILYIKNPNIYIIHFLIPHFFFHFVELLEFQSVLDGHLSLA